MTIIDLIVDPQATSRYRELHARATWQRSSLLDTREKFGRNKQVYCARPLIRHRPPMKANSPIVYMIVSECPILFFLVRKYDNA